MYIGPYVSLNTDFFNGKEVDAVPGTAVARLKLEDLVVTRLVFGARLREQFGAFFMDQHIGVGPVFYGNGKAENLLNTDQDLEFLKASVNLTAEIGLRFGIAASRRVDFGLDADLEFNGPPERGGDIPDTGFEFKGQANFVLTFGVNLNF